MNLTPDEAYDQIKDIATSCNSWGHENMPNQRNQVGTYELNKMDALEEQEVAMENQLIIMKATIT